MDKLTHIHSPAYRATYYIQDSTTNQSLARQATTHTKLDYKPPLSLQFNGKELQILEWGEVKRDKLDSNIFDKKRIFQARSGKPIPIASQNNTNTQNNNTNYIGNPILNPDNPQEYFDYSKQRQKEKDKGAIPEGIYYIDINKSKNDKSSGIRMVSKRDRQIQWGKYNIPIYTNKECTNTIESTTQRNNFYIHGGESYGDNGGIDLAKEDTRFFETLESIKKEYKDILESLKDNEGRMVVRLGVGYEEELSWIKIARTELGVLEIKGAEHNPRIIQYHSTTTGKFQDDETPWCSSFVNWVITQAGLKGTNSARAASWKDWGQKLNKAAYGV